MTLRNLWGANLRATSAHGELMRHPFRCRCPARTKSLLIQGGVDTISTCSTHAPPREPRLLTTWRSGSQPLLQYLVLRLPTLLPSPLCRSVCCNPFAAIVRSWTVYVSFPLLRCSSYCNAALFTLVTWQHLISWSVHG